VNQLAAINHKIPPSVKLRISFYNLRKFCESSFVLSDESFEFFHKKFEKLVCLFYQKTFLHSNSLGFRKQCASLIMDTMWLGVSLPDFFLFRHKCFHCRVTLFYLI
jgi:hypothetical protein